MPWPVNAYLTMKYALDNGHVGVVKGDQDEARKCQQDNLKVKKLAIIVYPTPKHGPHNVNFVDLNLREEYLKDMLIPTKDLKKVHSIREVPLLFISKKSERGWLRTQVNSDVAHNWKIISQLGGGIKDT